MKHLINWSEFLPCASPHVSNPGVRVLCEGYTAVIADTETEAYEAMRLAFPAIQIQEAEQ